MNNENKIVVLSALEFSSIVIGYKAMDEMVKIAPITIIDARTISSGKYLIIFSGDVASVEYAYRKGLDTGMGLIVDSRFLPQVHKDVISAIGTTLNTLKWDAIGIIETKSIISSIEAADAAAKDAEVKIIEIRLADGFAGKSYVNMISELTDVQESMGAGISHAKAKEKLVMDTIIPHLHKGMKPFFM